MSVIQGTKMISTIDSRSLKGQRPFLIYKGTRIHWLYWIGSTGLRAIWKGTMILPSYIPTWKSPRMRPWDNQDYVSNHRSILLEVRQDGNSLDNTHGRIYRFKIHKLRKMIFYRYLRDHMVVGIGWPYGNPSEVLCVSTIR